MSDDLAAMMAEDAQAPAEASKSEMSEILSLATELRTILGWSLEAPPSSDAVGGVLDWAKSKKVTDLPLSDALKSATIAELVCALAAKLKVYRAIAETKLPESMKAVGGVGLKSFTMEDGAFIEIKDDCFCSLKAGKDTDILEYLKGKQLADIMKEKVTFNFQWDDEEKVKALEELAQEKNIPFESKKSIHPATLKATIGKLRAKGEVPPEELFSIFDFQKAIIKLPKNK